MNKFEKGCLLSFFILLTVVILLQANVNLKQRTIISDLSGVNNEQEVTIKHLNELQEGLIKGEGYTVTRQENTDTVRYLVGSCVKKEVQMFVPVDK